MELREWELQQQLSTILPLEEAELTQILDHVNRLSTPEATGYFNDLLGDSPEALKFIAAYHDARINTGADGDLGEVKSESHRSGQPSSEAVPEVTRVESGSGAQSTTISNEKGDKWRAPTTAEPPAYAPPPGRPPQPARAPIRLHTNPVIEAGDVRAQDEVR
jgi:hypothetical protein